MPTPSTPSTHFWYHPHVHMIVPGGGLSEDGTRWIACRPSFFLAVRVLSRLFRRLVLLMLIAAHEAGRLQFFGAHAALAEYQRVRRLPRPISTCRVCFSPSARES